MKKKTIHLTRLELEVMEIIWRLGAPSVREVQESISEKKRPAYTTIQTIMQRLEQKDAIRRSRKIGNAFLFEPLITQKSVYRKIVDELLDLFGGSAQPVIAHLMESGKLTLEDLKAVEESVKKQEKP
jgi:BlaI family penicillinase repressor